MSFTTTTDLITYLRDEEVEYLDIRFTDVPGIEHALTVPASALTEESAAEGFAFDGSSIAGFTSVDESDMTLMPDVSTAYLDPFRRRKTVNMQFFVHDPFTREPFSRDPRNIARKAEEYMRASGIADECFIGAEAEFFVFDSVRYSTDVNRAFHEVDSDEGWWNSDAKTMIDGSPNLGNKIRVNDGYFPTAPYDKTIPVRDEIAHNLSQVGFEIERFHHEVSTGGIQEVNYKFNTLLHAADDLQKFKYIVKNTADEHGKVATFMPKPLLDDGGCGMHAHQSLWKDGKPLFYDEEGYAGLSDMARHYIGGLLAHAPAVLAFTNPTVNSYRRLYSGFEAPVNLVYSQRNRSAAIRIPVTGPSPKAKRIEFRAPDPSGNPYLGFAAQLLAGLDGIKNRIEPGEPVDKDLYELEPEEAAKVPRVPHSLENALYALENDHDFLTEGDVFTEDLIESYIALKYDNEINPLRQGPTPKEFELYFNC
ncbi:type I glutamate--ammonia ligase [Corynebacterium marinum]|uniref:Glutamine synthetase n=2 Tax=Corynebacterium marinum TaxID=349751 RepID=A0A0B6TSV9_9CORY|nr:type I glutamate--ammonia ligase [Corynebacterium marinum]AJK69324.1 Glutamine synthetase 1 [Corynebacterium marinum DSM 44953]NLF89735.1 type I glutamate--ammonia ligase [Corynebacterium marinum]GGO16521.1 glutamine synthetase [Corynebacterium marinum]